MGSDSKAQLAGSLGALPLYDWTVSAAAGCQQ